MNKRTSKLQCNRKSSPQDLCKTILVTHASCNSCLQTGAMQIAVQRSPSVSLQAKSNANKSYRISIICQFFFPCSSAALAVGRRSRRVYGIAGDPLSQKSPLLQLHCQLLLVKLLNREQSLRRYFYMQRSSLCLKENNTSFFEIVRNLQGT